MLVHYKDDKPKRQKDKNSTNTRHTGFGYLMPRLSTYIFAAMQSRNQAFFPFRMVPCVDTARWRNAYNKIRK